MPKSKIGINDNAGAKHIKSFDYDITHYILDSDNKTITKKQYVLYCWDIQGLKPEKALERLDTMMYLDKLDMDEYENITVLENGMLSIREIERKKKEDKMKPYKEAKKNLEKENDKKVSLEDANRNTYLLYVEGCKKNEEEPINYDVWYNKFGIKGGK